MADKKFEPVIGLEVHVQVKTLSKMFCGCKAKYFNDPPNSNICPVCLGLPGALPVPNKLAIGKCIKLALALNCSINRESKFDRKNYFYPDLPKGYQISQYDQPIGFDGYLDIETKDNRQSKIRIRRVHIEEDTGKSLHPGYMSRTTPGAISIDTSQTLLDFNKSGVPLAEIVTEPDFEDVAQVNAYAKRLRQIVRYLDISDADMEKGQMRFELNISLRPSGSKELPAYKVEVKNIGSISVLEKVIASETVRQAEILNSGRTPVQETRGLKDMSGVTVSQRVKEEAHDYRYFPEPDIPPLEFGKAMLSEIKKQIGELPQDKKTRYIKDYGLDPVSAEVIIASPARAAWFEAAVGDNKDTKLSKELAKWYTGEFFALLKSAKMKLKESKISPAQLAGLAAMVAEGKLSGPLAKQALREMFMSGKNAKEVVSENNMQPVSDESEIAAVVTKVVAANQKVVKDISKNPNAIKFLLGQVMRETKGRADPVRAEELIRKELGL